MAETNDFPCFEKQMKHFLLKLAKNFHLKQIPSMENFSQMGEVINNWE